MVKKKKVLSYAAMCYFLGVIPRVLHFTFFLKWDTYNFTNLSGENLSKNMGIYRYEHSYHFNQTYLPFF